jgi:hypothetical protein
MGLLSYAYAAVNVASTPLAPPANQISPGKPFCSVASLKACRYVAQAARASEEICANDTAWRRSCQGGKKGLSWNNQLEMKPGDAASLVP